MNLNYFNLKIALVNVLKSYQRATKKDIHKFENHLLHHFMELI